MAKCKYRYKSKSFEGKQCSHEALPGSDYCIWHEQKDRKDFSGKTIQERDLIEAYLVGAKLVGANLQEVDLSNANLQKAILWLASFQKADLQHANLRKAQLQEAILVGVNLQEVDLAAASLEGAVLQDAILWGAILHGAILVGTNFHGADLIAADLQEVKDLSNANFQEVCLAGAKFQTADLSDANFQGVDLSYADFTNAVFDRADLRGAFLYAAHIIGAKGLQYAKIGDKCIEETLADRLDEILANREKLRPKLQNIPKDDREKLENIFDKYLREELKPECRNLGFEENEFNQFTICKTTPISENMKLCHILQPNQKITTYEKLKIKKFLYEHARDVYIALKTYFRDVGVYEKSGKFFIGEFRARGKLHKIESDINRYLLKERPKSFKERCRLLKGLAGNYLKFLINKFLYSTSSYGESVGRLLFTVILTILLYAVLYSLGGIKASGICHPIHNLFTALYFSIVTFTTLGYGDLHPTNNISMRLIAGSEAFIGAFLLAYFVVVVSRKIMR